MNEILYRLYEYVFYHVLAANTLLPPVQLKWRLRTTGLRTSLYVHLLGFASCLFASLFCTTFVQQPILNLIYK